MYYWVCYFSHCRIILLLYWYHLFYGDCFGLYFWLQLVLKNYSTIPCLLYQIIDEQNLSVFSKTAIYLYDFFLCITFSFNLFIIHIHFLSQILLLEFHEIVETFICLILLFFLLNSSFFLPLTHSSVCIRKHWMLMIKIAKRSIAMLVENVSLRATVSELNYHWSGKYSTSIGWFFYRKNVYYIQ